MRGKVIFPLLAAAVLAAGCGADKLQPENKETAARIPQDIDESAVTVRCSGDQAEAAGDGVTAEKGLITITKEGAYRFSGSFLGRIVVDAGGGRVRLILNGISVESPDGTALYGKESGEIILEPAEGTVNEFSDAGSYLYDGEEKGKEDAAVYSKGKLTVDGRGTIAVNGNFENGIHSRDSVRLASGNVRVTAVKDGIKGKDGVIVQGGNIEIRAGDDGIQTENTLSVRGGTVAVIRSEEGLEGYTVEIEGGTVRIAAEDDGINAAGGSQDKKGADENAWIRISGGDVYVNAQGDGLDSNGNLYVDGGTVYVDGPTGEDNGALDYNGEGFITGGTVVAVGSRGMAAGFSEKSEQNSVLIFFDKELEAGTKLLLQDESGKTILSYTPSKKYASAAVSTPLFETGRTYTAQAGGAGKAEFTVKAAFTCAGDEKNY